MLKKKKKVLLVMAVLCSQFIWSRIIFSFIRRRVNGELSVSKMVMNIVCMSEWYSVTVVCFCFFFSLEIIPPGWKAQFGDGINRYVYSCICICLPSWVFFGQLCKHFCPWALTFVSFGMCGSCVYLVFMWVRCAWWSSNRKRFLFICHGWQTSSRI